MDVSLIISELKDLKNFSTDTELADFIGIHRQSLTDWKRRNRVDANKIKRAFPEVRREWLRTGEGEMLEPQAPHATINQRNVAGRNEAHVAQGDAGAAELIARLREAQAQVTKSQEQIDRLLGIIEGLTGRG